MYLRPTPATVDPSVPGSTRRQQISVRPGMKETVRGNPPPPKRTVPERSVPERAASERTITPERGGTERQQQRRERPPEPVVAPSSRPPASRPRTAMVVSPVSLTPEEVQPGARPKMPTLLGLGGAMDTPQFHSAQSLSAQSPSAQHHSSGAELRHSRQPAAAGSRQAESPASDPFASRFLGAPRAAADAAGAKPPASDPMASDGAAGARASGRRAKGAARAERHEPVRGPAGASHAAPNDGSFALGGAAAARDDGGYALGGAVSEQPTGFDALAMQIAVEAPNDIVSSVQLLADFALKLSLGPVSRLWVPDVRRSVDALLLTGKHRNETALVALSSRLLEVLPKESREWEAHAASPSSATPAHGGAPASDAGAASEGAAASAAGAVSEAGAVTEAGAVPEAAAASDAGSVSEASAALDAGAVREASAAPELAAPPDVAPADVSSESDARNAPASTTAAEAAESAPPDAEPTGVTPTDVTPLDGALRERILHELSRLAGVLPEWPAPAQDLAEEARRRETRVMRELLAQVDGLKRDQRARLEEQMRLEELAAMSSEAIAEEFDAPLERAGEVRHLLDGYRLERQTRAPDVGNAVGLGLALDELERRSQAFDDCDPEQKEALRVLRAERRQALSAVNLLLAERGELDWLEQIEPLAIGERVERLKQWLHNGGERNN
jgi:hypothetical protein